jgi:2-polyprenyl-3-methyl-5-hydroxy-6-metoxy-1,4-benzoquinol methylase
MNDKYRKFQNLGFEDFRRMASDSSLSSHEKIGFPDEYREGKEAAIFQDILAKLPRLRASEKKILDIGPGCAGLAHMIIEHCQVQGHHLVLIDSEEMLSHLPQSDSVEHVAGFFPNCPEFIARHRGKFDAIIVYSVFHYIFAETSIFQFLDSTMELIAPGGAALIGDIPNTSKRKRFFSSDTGKNFHRDFTGKNEDPVVDHLGIVHGDIDDAVVFSLLQRARSAGFDGYVLPQGDALPMANRREDLLIARP